MMSKSIHFIQNCDNQTDYYYAACGKRVLYLNCTNGKQNCTCVHCLSQLMKHETNANMRDWLMDKIKSLTK